MNDDDNIEPIRRICDRLGEIANQLGLEMVQVGLIPDLERSGRDAISAVFVLAEGAIPEPEPELPPELADQDPELEAMVEDMWAGSAEAEKEQLREEQRRRDAAQKAEIRDSLESMRNALRSGKGPLDD